MEKDENDMIAGNFVSDIRTIIEQGRKQAYAATGQVAIMTYWNIGRRIVEEEQHGESRAVVIFELKTHKLTHQDIGQLDMYICMYDDLVKGQDDHPTIGVLLCTDTDSTIAKYSVLHDSDQIFAAKYMTYMPTEEELRREIELQKRFFMEQHGKEEV